ncbi:MAG TPA: cupin domain-containing protein [Bryobacteraceae bacterium]|nr:cupin domain-containing protein [Bryobacteraceae bacterium]
MVQLRLLSVIALGALAAAQQAERKVDPSFLRRHLPDVAAKAADVTTDSCRYKPLFGAGDGETTIVRGVARFGEMTVSPGGASKAVNYAAEEQVYVIMEGIGVLHYGTDTAPVRKHDFLYLPAGVEHWLANPAGTPLRLFVMGFKLPESAPPPPKLLIANYDEVAKQNVSGHPDSVVYQLMMGDVTSRRDRLAAAHVLTSLYVMEFEPGGTNFPHHHDAEEEIYVLLDGSGDMVAGSGANGLEARFPATPGDAYFFRLNCTVGFYNSTHGPAHILAVRSLFPRHGSGSR